MASIQSHVQFISTGVQAYPASENRVELARAFRILFALCGIWFISACDLLFTVSESAFQHFSELNPLAAMFVDCPPALLAIYKLSLLTFGTVLLVALRRHRASETGCWVLLAAYVLLALRWFVYFQGLYSTRDNLIVSTLAYLP